MWTLWYRSKINGITFERCLFSRSLTLSSYHLHLSELFVSAVYSPSVSCNISLSNFLSTLDVFRFSSSHLPLFYFHTHYIILTMCSTTLFTLPYLTFPNHSSMIGSLQYRAWCGCYCQQRLISFTISLLDCFIYSLSFDIFDIIFWKNDSVISVKFSDEIMPPRLKFHLNFQFF